MTKPMSLNAVNRANQAIKALLELTETDINHIFRLEVCGMINRLRKEINKK